MPHPLVPPFAPRLTPRLAPRLAFRLATQVNDIDAPTIWNGSFIVDMAGVLSHNAWRFRPRIGSLVSFVAV